MFLYFRFCLPCGSRTPSHLFNKKIVYLITEDIYPRLKALIPTLHWGAKRDEDRKMDEFFREQFEKALEFQRYIVKCLLPNKQLAATIQEDQTPTEIPCTTGLVETNPSNATSCLPSNANPDCDAESVVQSSNCAGSHTNRCRG